MIGVAGAICRRSMPGTTGGWRHVSGAEFASGIWRRGCRYEPAMVVVSVAIAAALTALMPPKTWTATTPPA